jgi:hypothetical protein
MHRLLSPMPERIEMMRGVISIVEANPIALSFMLVVFVWESMEVGVLP